MRDAHVNPPVNPFVSIFIFGRPSHATIKEIEIENNIGDN
jgi:hypothetical protein